MSLPYASSAPRVSSPEISLQPGQAFVPPAGEYLYKGGSHTSLQRLDPASGQWRFAGDDSNAFRLMRFDGTSLRICNPTGCPWGAVVTTAGSGYTSAPAVTASAGSSTWQSIIGGAVSTAGVIAVGGSGYLYPPTVWIEQPPYPGVQATATVAITNGSISSLTVVDQGAGYLYPPQAALVNDWRDTVGGGGQVVLSLTGAGTVTAVLCTNHGNPITSGTVPTLAFGSGAAAATVVMDWGVTSVSITTAGAGYATSGALLATGAGGYVTTAPAYLGSLATLGMARWRKAQISMTTNSGGGMSALGAIIDGGRYQGVPTPVITAGAPPTTTGVLAFTMGGANSTVFLMPIQQ